MPDNEISRLKARRGVTELPSDIEHAICQVMTTLTEIEMIAASGASSSAAMMLAVRSSDWRRILESKLVPPVV